MEGTTPNTIKLIVKLDRGWPWKEASSNLGPRQCQCLTYYNDYVFPGCVPPTGALKGYMPMIPTDYRIGNFK